MLYTPSRENQFDLSIAMREISKRAKELFGWKPRHLEFMEEPFFRQQELQEPSDSQHDLLNAIEKYIKPNDTVLSPPAHLGLFRNCGCTVVVYDISPLQLSSVDQGTPTYWCDVFNNSALVTLLEQVKPTVLNLSNIPEWASDGTPQLEELVEVINQIKKLDRVFVSTVIKTGGHIQKLAELFIEKGWVSEIFQEDVDNPENIVVISRKVGQGIN